MMRARGKRYAILPSGSWRLHHCGRARIAQLPRSAGEKHPYETDEATVQRYFEMGALCAEAQRLSMQSAN
jgi:hypothetical protein